MEGNETAAVETGQAAPQAAQEPATEPAADGADAGAETQPEGQKQQTRLAAIQRQLLEQQRLNRKLQKQQAELAERAKLVERIEKGDYAALQELGMRPDKWALQQLAGTQKTPEQEAEEARERKLAELEQWKQQQEEERRTYQQQAQRQQLSSAVKQAVEAREDLAFTARLGQSDVILDKIQEYAAEYGDCPPDEQERIASAVEREMRESVSASLKALLDVPDFRSLVTEALKGYGEQAQPDQQASTSQQPSKATRPRANTLTNSQSAAGAARTTSDVRSLDEKRRAAIERLEKRARDRRA